MATHNPELNEVIRARISTKELAAVREFAARSGLSLSDLIRLLLRLAVSGEVKVKRE